MSRLAYKLIITLWFALLTISFAQANNGKNNNNAKCQGQFDFTVTFDVLGQDGVYQDMYFTQGNKREETLWYTPPLPEGAPDPNDGAYLFDETGLVNTQQYSVKIEHDADSDTSYYYLKSETDNEFVYTGRYIVQSIKEGNLVWTGTDIGDVNCSADPVSPPPSGGDYYIEYIPTSNQIGLTCDAPLGVTFQVYNSDGSAKEDYTGGITVTASNSTALFNGTDPSGTVYDPNNQGELAITLSDSVVNDVVVTATLDNSENDSGQYKFVARLFRFAENVNNTSNLVAGLEVQNIAVQPLECDEDGDVAVSDDYTGTHAVDFFSTNYKSPSSANLNREVYVQVNSNSLNSQKTINLDFGTDSTAYINVRYDEAGIVDYRIEDEICLKDDGGEVTDECVTTTGTHNLNVRPWTFALCDPSGSENGLTGNSESGALFKRSGELFSLDVIPIRYVAGAFDPDVAVDVSGYCTSFEQGGGLANPDLETKNFYPDTAPAVNVTLEAELHSPSVSLGSEADGTIGSGLEGVPTNGIPNVGIDGNRTSGPVLFESLLWREAGSITVTASLKDQADYLFEPINPGYRSVGRFSPNHLAMLDEGNDPDDSWIQWDYADGHDDFAYMSQAITHTFNVQAQDIDGNPTENYGLFNNALIVTIDYMAQTQGELPEVDFMDEDALRVEGLQTWAGASWPKSLANDPSTLFIEIVDFRFMKKVHSTIDPYVVTQPDGPYSTTNSVFGLEVSTMIDDVNFDTLDIEDLNPEEGQDPQENVGRKFPKQPDFRYGRMKMDDVGGNSGQEIRVPLRTEYWDGDAFIVNTDDGSIDNETPVGSSYVSAGRFCTQVIWSNDSSTSGASLNGSDTVEQGRSEELYATHSKQSETHREQVRLWLRQGATSPQRSESGIDCNTNGGNFTNQPWLQYNWRDEGDEDPSAVVTFGTFRGNDRIIFKGERALMGN
ncbi:DUF6701 domain-containing protein [Vibrio superstes]|uniref:DUF6701 domain-containing protein n=1 Tax=Vibrio superstes NBRC 103154 TaxID=1219062 RepID=A0A511QUB8_9VIBR|nr:DUF6701 domain-containing protein [Vibrio superstes]GEM80950.1 hypothetical protein VSU01S_31950 [Vibrio superstes NBRC 103154]